MKKHLLVFLLFAIPFSSFAQKWKRARYDLVMGLGSTTFLGELGGANKVGSHFGRDIDFSTSRPSATVGIRYRLSEYFAARTNFSYGRLKGDDKKTTEFFRSYRNLSFATDVYEFSVNMEAAFMKEQSGRKYRLRGVRGRRGYELYLYGFAGIGGFYFNPKAQLDGRWVALQPLHTEGQGLLPSREPYKRLQICVPTGIGFKYSLSKKLMIGVEWGVRYTFTDYIDDVSTTYVNPNILSAQPNGAIAVQLADRSNYGNPDGPGSVGGITAPGQQRGDPRYTDAYIFSLITLNYKLRITKGNLPRF